MITLVLLDMAGDMPAGSTLQADQVVFNQLRQLPRYRIPSILHDLRNLERKVFPPNEVFPFEDNPIAKQNMVVLVGLSNQSKVSEMVAYAVCIRWNGRLLLHKICVAPAYRRIGIGTKLIQMIVECARRWSCRGIDLWVHEANYNARCLYSRSGFELQETVTDYYAKGRNGIKMCHVLEA